MQARMKNPALVLGAMEPFQALFEAVYAGGVDKTTLDLVHLRANDRDYQPVQPPHATTHQIAGAWE